MWSRKAITQEIECLTCYRSWTAEGRYQSEGGCLLEIGANIGTHTVYFAVTGRFGRIVSVEPDPRNLSFLRKNVALNGITELGSGLIRATM